jgi:hypothetical protein
MPQTADIEVIMDTAKAFSILSDDDLPTLLEHMRGPSVDWSQYDGLDFGSSATTAGQQMDAHSNQGRRSMSRVSSVAARRERSQSGLSVATAHYGDGTSSYNVQPLFTAIDREAVGEEAGFGIQLSTDCVHNMIWEEPCERYLNTGTSMRRPFATLIY